MDDFGYTKESNFENIANAIRSKNGTDNTYAPSEMADAIKDINTTLQEKALLIDHNGTYEITPTDGAYGLSKVNVSTNIDMTFINLYIEKLTLGLDRAVAGGYLSEEVKQQIIEFFIERGGGSDYHYWDDTFKFIPYTNKVDANVFGKYGVAVFDYSFEYGSPYDLSADVIIYNMRVGYVSNPYAMIYQCYCCVLNGIKLSTSSQMFVSAGTLEKIFGGITIGKSFSNFSECFSFTNIEELPIFYDEGATITTLNSFIRSNRKIKHIANLPSIGNSANLRDAFSSCSNLESININCLDTISIYRVAMLCLKLKSIKTINLINCTNSNATFQSFYECYELEECLLTNWRAANLSFQHSPNLSIESINGLIENCDKDGGAQVARTLTLHATAGARWADETQNPRYSELLSKANQCLIQIIY